MRRSCCRRPITRSFCVVLSRVAVQARLDAHLLEQPLERAPGLVAAHHRKEPRPRAELLAVPGHVGGAAEQFLFVLVDQHHRHRRSGEMRDTSPNQ